MLATMSRLHTTLPTPENISVLVVSANREDYTAVCRILRHGQWRISRALSCNEALPLMREQSFAVVLCEKDLPDGCWRDLVKHAAELPNPPALLVISRYADDKLWSDVLNTGGYDVLPKPLDSGEVTRVIGMAWRHSLSSWLRKKDVASVYA